jgi:choline kinase
MNAIILAAGRGSRLTNLTDTIPKCLVRINKKSLLSRQLEIYNSLPEISNISIVRGYLKEKINDKRINKYFENEEWKRTNMVSSLYTCKEILKEKDSIISYGDIFFGYKIINKLINDHNDIVISYDSDFLKLWSKRFKNPLDDLETFKIDENQYLIDIGDKTDNIQKIEGQYMGLLKITRNGWNKIDNLLCKINFNNIDMTQLLKILLNENLKIKTVQNKEIWGEVDTPHDITIYENEYDI